MSAYWWALRLIQSFEVNSPALPLRCAMADNRRTTSSPRYHLRTLPPSAIANEHQILRRPGFHRAVGRIHKTINEKQYGRNPQEPLAPGEATADPNSNDRRSQFAKHFLDELKNQFRGKPTEFPGERPKK
ncbi:hypothetical protein FDECE_11485 [Fusarium decemcellulare]|nr:hypothetical protein FDECE_11485 [Fusarium decemcellulare]